MAYPSVNAPYGFVPINRLDGMAYAGATRQFPVTQAGAMYFGDLIELDVGGIVGTSTSLTGGAKIGVFVGCQYTNTQGQTVQAQYYPGSAAATNAIAYVVDDPYAVFKVAVTTSAGAISFVTQAAVGTNVTALAGTPNALSGNSGASILNTSPANTNTFPLRVVAGVPETATDDGFTEVIVKINLHQYNTILGNAMPE
jgi:hypothetical protein